MGYSINTHLTLFHCLYDRWPDIFLAEPHEDREANQLREKCQIDIHSNTLVGLLVGGSSTAITIEAPNDRSLQREKNIEADTDADHRNRVDQTHHNKELGTQHRN